MIELKRGDSVTFFKVTVTTMKHRTPVVKDYLVDEYEAPCANLAIAFVMEKISSLVAVNHVSVIEFKIDFPDKL